MKNIVKITLLTLFVIATLIAMSFGMFLLGIPSTPLNHRLLDTVSDIIRYVDASGEEMHGVTTGRNASKVNIDTLSNETLYAFICTEDKRFYSHNGVDFRRVLSSLTKNILQGSAAQGGSTITQQLAKNTHLSQNKTITRKIQELRLANEIEEHYSKNQILEMYLNAIYFGNNVYGLESAAQFYFNTHANDLAVEQAAALAAIINAPARYNPLKHPDALRKRRNLVLKNMLDQDKLDENRYREAIEKDIAIVKSNSAAGYYLACAAEEAKQYLYGKDLAGYTVYTNYCDAEQRKLAEALTIAPDVRAKGVLTDLCGGIVASYSSDPTTVALKRQPGSAIKPIAVYAPAIERGIISPATPILDDETSFGGYAPKNYGGGHSGWISARQALSSSNNVAAIKILEMTGIDYAFDFSSELGLPLVDQDRVLPMALGGLTYGVTAEQLAGAYAAFNTNGEGFREACYINRIADADGNVIFARPQFCAPSMSQETAALVRDMMQTCVRSGTASGLADLPFNVAAKTGTVGQADTKENTDAYCAGLTSEHSFCIWLGSASGSVLPAQIRGGTLPVKIARQLLDSIYTDAPKPFCDNLKSIELDAEAYLTEHILVEAPSFLADKDKITEKFGFRCRPALAHIVIPTLSAHKKGNDMILTLTGDRYADYQLVRYSFFDTTVIPIGKLTNGSAVVRDSAHNGSILRSYRVLALYPDGSKQLSDVVKVVD